jgi:hypothetical protein
MGARGGWRRQLLGIGAALCVALPGPASWAHAADWQVFNWTLPGRLRQVRVVAWRGRPAVMATAPTRAGDGSEVSAFQMLRLSGTQVDLVANWTVPGFLRWAEPVRYAPGQQGWLALRNDGWYLAQEIEGQLAWRRVCACPTVFGDKEDPDPLATAFAFDMNGDGVDEVVLPDPDGITVYRWMADAALLEPWWRYRWEEPLLHDPKHPAAWQLPKYWLLDTHRSGTRDLVLHHAERLAVYAYPGALTPRYAFNGAARVRLESVLLPPGLRRALVALGDASYADAERLLAALPLPGDAKQRADWLSALPGALWAARVDPPVLLPEKLPLPGAPALHAGDYAFPVALEDLTGNGYVDLLQAAVRTDNSVLGMRGELRLYTGAFQDGHWSFPVEGTPITTNGAAVAELFRAGTDRAAPAALAVASTEVTLGAILRGLSTGKVRLDLDLHLLQAGKFDPHPNQHTRVVLEGLGSGARPLVLAADIDGDGWRELLINRQPDLLIAYRGSSQGAQLSSPPLTELRGPLPRKPEEAFVADLDGNGREDLVFWYRSGRYSDLLRRTLTFARWQE